MNTREKLIVEAIEVNKPVGLLSASDAARWVTDIGSQRGIIDGAMSPAEAMRIAATLGIKLAE